MKAEISTIDEEFEKSRIRGAKDRVKRKTRKNVSVKEIMRLRSMGVLTKEEAMKQVSKIPGWEEKVKSYIKKYQPWKKEKLSQIYK